jgi:hypothetical protein
LVVGAFAPKTVVRVPTIRRLKSTVVTTSKQALALDFSAR